MFHNKQQKESNHSDQQRELKERLDKLKSHLKLLIEERNAMVSPVWKVGHKLAVSYRDNSENVEAITKLETEKAQLEKIVEQSPLGKQIDLEYEEIKKIEIALRGSCNLDAPYSLEKKKK